MARFDIYRMSDRAGYLLDCQADVLSSLTTRFVIPLMPAVGLPRADRLNPVFQIEGQRVVMATQLASSVPARLLGSPIQSLAEEQPAIMNAIDMLLTGY
jgi:toxin CcdB